MDIFDNFNNKNVKLVCKIDEKINLNGKDYIVDKQLGGGGQSYVLKILEEIQEDEFKEYALKICKTKNKVLKNKDKQVTKVLLNSSFKKEVNIAKEFSGVEYKTNFITYHFDGYLELRKSDNTNYHSYYVMDLADEALENYLCQRLNWEEEQEIYPKLKELATTVKLLHEKDYVHRDIKPQNILIHGDLLKLADFGMVEKENTTCEKYGPKYWPTPELLEMCDDDVHCSGKRTDVFMLGCIFYFIYTKKYPIGNIDIGLLKPEYKMKEIITKMISYKQDDRYNCGNEVLDSINAIDFAQQAKKQVKHLTMAQVEKRKRKR